MHPNVKIFTYTVYYMGRYRQRDRNLCRYVYIIQKEVTFSLTGSKTWRFIATNTKAYTWSWASSVHFPSSQMISIILILMLYSHRLLSLSSEYFLKGFLIKILYIFIVFFIWATCPAYHNIDFSFLAIYCMVFKSWYSKTGCLILLGWTNILIT